MNLPAVIAFLACSAFGASWALLVVFAARRYARDLDARGRLMDARADFLSEWSKDLQDRAAELLRAQAGRRLP